MKRRFEDACKSGYAFITRLARVMVEIGNLTAEMVVR